MLQGNLTVLLEGIDPADLKHGDDVVGIFHGLLAVERNHCGGVEVILGDDLVGEAFHALELSARAAHEAEFAVPQGRGGDEVHKESLAEDDASGADHCYLGHGVFLLGVAWNRQVLL